MRIIQSRVKNVGKTLAVLIIIAIMGLLTSCDQTNPRQLHLSETIPEVDQGREASVLTAFFGLDNDLPPRSRIIDPKAPGKDGMPIVFSLEIDPATMEASDFLVTSKNGTIYQVEAASFLPANEEFELRTVLLIGEYGNHPDNPPVKVEVVDDLMSRSGKNFKGQAVKVIPLEEGPVLSYAEYFTIDDTYPYKEKGAGCDCPKAETQMVVKAVWSGGVRAIGGDELSDDDRESFTVKLLHDGDTISVHPFTLADLDDNDNNIDLCLKEKGAPFYLEVRENTAIDPRDDSNARTYVEVVSRW